MSRRWRKRFLWLLAAVLIVPVALYLAADLWLESSGGRRLLERELTKRAGMDVEIRGEFDLMLIPSIGVSGTDLVVGGPAEDAVFASSRVFEVSVALRPLLSRIVQVEWVRLSGGRVYPGRYRQADGSGEASAFTLPAISELTVRDFRFVFSDEENDALLLSEFSVSEFRADSETPFSLAIGDDISARGILRWDPTAALLSLADLHLELAGQTINGRACLRLSQPRSADAVLHADLLDLDAVRAVLSDYSLPGSSADPGGAANGGGWLDGFNMALSIDELVSGDTLAKGVVLGVGKPAATVCGSD